jgi:hypothetical protein
MSQLGRFILAYSAIAAAVLAGARLTLAAECGNDTPDYTAKRTITVNGSPMVLLVFVSGSRTREEQDVGGKTMIVLRLPEQNTSYAFDPGSKQGVRLPPVQQKQNKTRVVDEPDADGSRLRHLQFLSDGKWVELSATKCSAVGVMLHQTFTSFDQQGRLVTGELTQTDVKIAPLPASLFRLPDGVVILNR